MSNTSGGSFYVRDLDRYISFSSLDADWEKEHRRSDWESAVGDIELLDGRFTQSFYLQEQFGSSIQDWKFSRYQALRMLGDNKTWRNIQPALVKELLKAGNAYAIRRYARKEKVSVSAAQTAAITYGITAIMSRFFSLENVHLTSQQRRSVMEVFRGALDHAELTAYDKTALVREEIGHIVTDAWGKLDSDRLNKERVRRVLSLIRLNFSVAEMRVRGFADLADLKAKYARRREHQNTSRPSFLRPNAQFIRGWEMQHLWPLTYFYPVPIRYAFERGERHLERERPEPSKAVAVNELALALCVMQAARERRSARCSGMPEASFDE
jgi:hypothetical protein